MISPSIHSRTQKIFIILCICVTAAFSRLDSMQSRKGTAPSSGCSTSQDLKKFNVFLRLCGFVLLSKEYFVKQILMVPENTTRSWIFIPAASRLHCLSCPQNRIFHCESPAFSRTVVALTALLYPLLNFAACMVSYQTTRSNNFITEVLPISSSILADHRLALSRAVF